MLKRGFTLLEVLIVVIIIGILAAIALPQYVNTLEKARSAEAMGILGSLRSSMDRYWYDQIASATSYTAATFSIGATGTLKLDLDNPNDNTSRKWNYGLTDSSSLSTKSYYYEAQRIGKTTTHWIQIDEDGEIRKSTALGGTGTKF